MPRLPDPDPLTVAGYTGSTFVGARISTVLDVEVIKVYESVLDTPAGSASD
ncbi:MULTISPECIES: hypothetical protein [Streptomyces]|uniref:hypothetical protein n=1 Tax=Streptomyces TaxID=1883 RepID=UPI0023DD0EEE|nr:hypothetical protein [Streptomyces sp. FXJ1.172]WEP00965.1 hypothetical protein A6P39_043400 [Streptomyces sp. FXJ1.172]